MSITRQFFPELNAITPFLQDFIQRDPFVRTRQSTFGVPIDLYEAPDAYHLQVDVPGYQKDEIQVNMDGNTLRIRGQKQQAQEKKDETKEKPKDQTLLLSERVATKSFERSLELPATIDESKIDAQLKDGVLSMKLGKQHGKQSTPIAIQ